MAGVKECWVTTALTEGQCINALILAKSLKRVITLRQLVVLVSDTVPKQLRKLLQEAFDVCLELDKNLITRSGKDFDLYAKLYCFSMVKWNKVVFLEPHNFVVTNCDELFKLNGFASVGSYDLTMFVTKPSTDIWKTVLAMANGTEIDYAKLLNELDEITILNNKFSVKVNLEEATLVTNLSDIKITSFTGTHPLELLSTNSENLITGQFENVLMDLWKNDWENGVVQSLISISTEIPFNGLGNYLQKYQEIKTPSPSPIMTEDYKNSVAIVGMSCRFPGANNLDEFWKLLIQGQDAIGPCPEGRWGTDRCEAVLEGQDLTCGGFLNCPVDEFDGKFFGVSPAEMSFIDPQQRLALQVTWEALEDAGIDPTSLKDTYTGVYGGSWRQDYQDMLIKLEVAQNDFLRTYLGNSFGVITARISHCLGLTGPSIGTESGCSSSMVAVDLACGSLLKGETDLSLACGVNLLLRPFTEQSIQGILAPDFHCKTFDESADGFARAEGCGVLVLKRYADAARDGDRVWGLIRGSAVVQEGRSRSLGTPTTYCEALAMKLALENAKVEPKDVSFVETHGTGTPVGDPLEVAAVAQVYSKGREEPLIIGSVKTNIGHTESCSGIAGIMKVLLSMKNELIPPHRNFNKLNPDIDLEAVPATIPLKAIEWKRNPEGKPRIAGVSSFGITGTDAHAIIQEPPEIPCDQPSVKLFSPRPCHILTLSGKSAETLDENIRNFTTFLEETNEKLEDIAYTANIGRGKFPYRAAVVGSNTTDILNTIKNPIKNQAPEDQPKICFLFTGQGSQYPGMAKSLYDQNPIFKINFDICDRHLSTNYGISIKDALWGDNTANIGRTIYSQTSIFCVEYCLLKLWESWGVTPDYVLGHSLGEFAAAVAAGILSFEDALKLVAERSRLIDALPGGKMLVLKENFKTVENLLKKFFVEPDNWLDYAAVNSPEQTVLAGSEENIRAFSDFCKSKHIKTHILDATHAFHSRHMDPILEEYRGIASKVKYSKPNCVYISGMEGCIVEDSRVDSDYWVRHTRESVQFVEASKAILNLGVTLFLEVGPQPVLSAMIMINSDDVNGIGPVKCLPSIRRQDDNWSTILNTLGQLYTSGIKINWKSFDQFSNTKIVTVPFYPFQSKAHWYDIPDSGPNAIHPLVGKPVSNASSIKFYNNKLAIEHADYLKDHVIGNKIIFPGAGFLEMCLVAGHAATQCTETGFFHPVSPITLENFTIETPLGLTETEGTELQAIVSSEDSGETKVTIYSKIILDKETQKWIRHASGLFSPFAIQTKDEESNVTDGLNLIRERCHEQLQIHEVYKELAKIGLKFGPRFQSLHGMQKGQNELCFEVAVPEKPENYFCHPVVIDALFQAIMISLNSQVKKLHVPVSVSKFVWFSNIETETCHIHCKIESNDAVAVLYDNNGKILAQMVGATLMETTVGTIMSSLEAQRMALPNMYENLWRTQLGPMERRADLSLCVCQTLFSAEFVQEMTSKHNPLNDNEQYLIDNSNKLYALYMIQCLYDFGWMPELGRTYDSNEMVTSFNVIPSLAAFLRYMIIELSHDGLFKIIHADRDNVKFKLVHTPTTQDQVRIDAEFLYKDMLPRFPIEIELGSATGRKLADILTGKESALPILFPSDPKEVSAEAYYKEALFSKNLLRQLNHYYTHLFTKCAEVLQQSKGLIRILEVGAGTGCQTEVILAHLEKYASGYEYTYTDISPSFFLRGKKIFENSKVRVLYKVFNIEVDAPSQGFIPNHYDIIIANNVIHATKSVSQTICNLRNLLRDDGIICISESMKPFRNTNITFGCLEGYWLFTDYELRPNNCEISLEKWDQVLTQNNFSKIKSFPSTGYHAGLIVGVATPSTKYTPLDGLISNKRDSVWVIFSDGSETSEYFVHKTEQLGNQVVVVTRAPSVYEKRGNFKYSIRPEEDSDMINLFSSITKETHFKIDGVLFLWGLNYTNSEYTPLCKPFLSLLKLMIPFDHPKLFVITEGVSDIGDCVVPTPVPSILWGMTKTFQNEKPDALCRCIDLQKSDKDNQQSSMDELKSAFSELFINDGEIYVAYRDNRRTVCRLSPWKVQNSALTIPKSERFRLLLAPSNAINDLRFAPVDKPSVGQNDIEVRVKAYALNFKDVLVVLKPSAEFDKYNTVGIDYAGVVTSIGENVTTRKVGDCVFGVNMDGDALPSHIVTGEYLVMNIPPEMTFNEAATLPAVASTAYLSLIQTAKLTSKDTILIHTASGGVGLVAIQIAKSVGATIVATAGSRRKRTYLKTLGIQHIFHSRNTNYEVDIRKALNGHGVDVVLNSLTSPGFKEASLNVCNEGARFIEMSKLNTWTPEDVQAMRPDVKYNIVDLSGSNTDEMETLLSQVANLSEKSIIHPIPYVRFDVSEIREALNYLQKAKHIGKVICVMPDPEMNKTSSSDSTIPMFNDRSTYLITGGLGGIGFEVAKWMAQSGAKHIALVGRSKPNDVVAAEVARLNSTGKNLITFQFDIGDIDQCRNLLTSLKSKDLNYPPLRGIMHAAGVLSDAIYTNQTWEKYEKTFHPKVRGGWNLHKCTLDYPLEHFVMFSSATSNLGSMGQSNHVSANMFLDTLASYRNSIGLPATTINWGQWGQVGVAAGMEVIGLQPFTVLQGISALEKIMKSQKVAASVVQINFAVAKQIFPSLSRYLEELKVTEQKLEIFLDTDNFWAEYDAGQDEKERLDQVKSLVRYVIHNILKLDTNDVLDDNEDFQNLGMDSLMMIEMKNALQSVIGVRAKITANSIRDCHNIQQLAAKLTALISGESGKLTQEELIQLIREDSILPENIQPASEMYCKPSEIKSILLTGATGNLGPYILRDLLLKQQVQKVYCLVREDKTLTSKQRLEKVLTEKGLIDEIPMDKIECINGSVTSPRLGLSDEKYLELSQNVDAVFHLAIKSNFVEGYRKYDASDVSNMRTINVLGILNVIEFVCSVKTKLMFHASSVVANGKVDADKSLSEDWPLQGEFDETMDLGYSISKYICDLLASQAVQRGIPIKVFRFPVVSGDSKRGANANYDNNQLILRLLSYFHLEAIPDLIAPLNILPVDVCSELSLKVFFNDDIFHEIYNIYNPYPHTEMELIPFAEEMGFKLKIVGVSEFIEKVEAKENSKLLHFIKGVSDSQNREQQERFFKYPPAFVDAFIQNPKKCFFSKKVAKLIPGYEKTIEDTVTVIKRELTRAKEVGIFEKFNV